MYNGLVVVSYALGDVRPGDGGFAAVPGSHKSNLPCPEEVKALLRQALVWDPDLSPQASGLLPLLCLPPESP